MNKLRVTANIRGRVQGVSFRYATSLQAQALGVTGWVKNLPDGTVQSCLEGDESSVRQLLDWLHSGPPGARVTGVDVDEHAYSGEFSGFEIVR